MGFNLTKWKNMKKILVVLTNVWKYENFDLKTGLWLSEFTHIYDILIKNGFEIQVCSISWWEVPVDPESLKPFLLDKISKKYWENDDFRKILKNTKKISEFKNEIFDWVYLAWGHGTMFDFPENFDLQEILKNHFEKWKLVSAICHWVWWLLNTKLSNWEYLIKEKNLTWFSFLEEYFAFRNKKVPFNLEKSLKNSGAKYKKSFFPMMSKVVVDWNLTTWQNPFSSKKMAEIVLNYFKNK